MRTSRYGPYTLCGWHVFSDLPLPELSQPATSALQDRRLSIELGTLQLEGGESYFSATADHGATLRIEGVAGFHIDSGAERVLVMPDADADPLLLRTYIYGSVLAILCYMRGLFPLHGSSVLLGDSAIIFTGPSGAGKSTLATALTLRGYPLLSDDVCAIDLTDPARPMLWPAFPRVKLLPDTIANFQLGAAADYSRATLGTKGHFGMAPLPATTMLSRPVPVSAIYALDTRQGQNVSRTPLHGKDTFLFVNGQSHRAFMGRELGLANQMFRQVTAIAAAVPVFRLERPDALEQLEEIVNLFEDLHGIERDTISSRS